MKTYIVAWCYALLIAHAFPALAAQTPPDGGTSATPYWLLVTFSAELSADDVSTLKGSPYQGVAVPITGAYDTAATPSVAELSARYAALGKAGAVDVWPWVFVNRMLGTNSAGDKRAQQPYFQNIRTLDFDKSGKAHQQFLTDWRSALRVAKATGAPGVVLDLEFYNNYPVAYAISRFSEQIGLPAAESAARLEQLGEELGVALSEEYPTAKVWLLTSALNNSADQRINGRAYYQPRGHIALGLLREISRRNLPSAVIEGGEDSLGYCHADLAGLKSAVDTRNSKLGPLLNQFQDHLLLSGTITLWSDSSLKQGWMTRGDCGASDVKQLEDFAPYLQLLSTSYNYIWVYGSGAGGYRPFDPTVAARYHALIRGVLPDK